MPNTESVKKSLRQSQHRRARNLSQKKALKEVVRDFKKAVESKPEEATKMLLRKILFIRIELVDLSLA